MLYDHSHRQLCPLRIEKRVNTRKVVLQFSFIREDHSMRLTYY
jgi:hypothetical protein